MKREITKKVSVLVLCVLLAFLFGCSRQSEQKLENVPEVSVTATQGDAKDTSRYISEKPLTVRVLLSDSASQPIKNFAPAQQEVFKRTNIKLDYEIVPSSSYQEKKNILFATNNWPDVASVKSADLTDYASTGIFEPLLQYVNETDMPNFYKFWTQFPELQKYLIDGELYGFPVIHRGTTANADAVMMRTDLLEKHGIPIPQTFDEVLDSLVELKKIYPSSIPWTGRKGTMQLIKALSYMMGSGYGSNGVYFDYDKEQYLFGPATSEFKEVLSYLNKAYTLGLLDPDFASTTAQQLESKMSSGRSFMYVDDSGFGVNYTKGLRKIPGNEQGKIQLIPIPENSFGQRRVISQAKDIPGTFYSVNASGKNIKNVIKLIDWMYSMEGSDITNYGVEGYSFRYNTKGEPEFLKDYILKFKDATPSTYYAVYSDLGITKLNFTLYACNTKTWFEIEKLAGNWDEVSDEYWSIVENDVDAYYPPYINPPLTANQAERATDLLQNLTTMLEQEYTKYIIGQEPIESWDKVIARCNQLGSEELVAIYNTADMPYRK